MKKFFCIIVAAVTVLSNFCIKGFVLDFVNPNIGFEPKCRSILLINLDTDTTVYGKNATERLPMASLTKIMTAILTIENIGKLPEKENTKIKIRNEILKSLDGTGSSLSNISAGEEYTILQLLHCLLVTSGNDAALVLADFIGKGSITNFVDMMNKKAKELNCNDTHFTNPHGLDSEDHYTTAKDLANIQKYAASLPFYTDVTSTVTSKILGDGKPFLVTTNFMIDKNRGGKYYYKYAKSGKTGSDSKAGKCLISVANNGKYSYMCVALGGFSDNSGENIAMLETKAMYEWAFNNLEMRKIASKDVPISKVKLNLAWGKKNLLLSTAKDYSAMLPKDILASSINCKLNIPDYVNAPISVGQKLGTATFSYANSVVATADLVSKDSAKRSNILFIVYLLKNIFMSFWFKLISGLIFAAFALYIVLFVRQNKYKRRRRKKTSFRKVRF